MSLNPLPLIANPPIRLGWRRGATIFGLALAFYVVGMARGVCTDDSAELQRLAPQMARLHAPGYPLQLLLGRAATAISPLPVPETITLLSPIAAALALAVLAAAVARATQSRWCAYAAVGILGISHTFWMQASLPEVYALNALFHAVAFWLAATAFTNPSSAPRCVLALGFLLGIAFGNHTTAVLMAPALGIPMFLDQWRRGKVAWGAWLGAMLLGLLGIVSQIAVLTIRFQQLAPIDPWLAGMDQPTWRTALWWLTGGTARSELFIFSPLEVIRRFVQFGAYFVYQFPSPSALLIIATLAPFIVKSANNPKLKYWKNSLLFLAALSIVYGINFNSSDVYVFFIPVYMVGAIIAAISFERIAWAMRGFLPGDPRRVLLVALMFCPPFWYAMVPFALEKAEVSLSDDKGNFYYLWPPKAHFFDEWNNQARAILDAVPPHSHLLTDWNYYHLLGYWADQQDPNDPPPYLINYQRQGDLLRPGNWGNYVIEHVLRYPSERVYFLGPPGHIGYDVTGIRLHTAGDHQSPAFIIAENANTPFPAYADFVIYKFAHRLLQYSAIEPGAILSGTGRNHIPVRPFYGGSGEIEQFQFNMTNMQSVESYLKNNEPPENDQRQRLWTAIREGNLDEIVAINAAAKPSPRVGIQQSSEPTGIPRVRILFPEDREALLK